MNSRLTPFDRECIMMIQNIIGAGVEIIEEPQHFTIKIPEQEEKLTQALSLAVDGRFGERHFEGNVLDGSLIFLVRYAEDAESLPQELRSDILEANAGIAAEYIHRGRVNAMKVKRENLNDLLEFTGGGTLTVPRALGALAKYSFISENGTMVDAMETDWILCKNGKFSVLNSANFVKLYSAYKPGHSAMQVQEIMSDINEWSVNVFKNQTSLSKAHHLREEVQELITALEHSISDVTVEKYLNVYEELADCMILLLDCATCSGVDAAEYLKHISRKMQINKRRKWGEPDANGVVRHIG